MFKKIIYISIGFFLFLKSSFAVSDVIKNGLLNGVKADDTIVANVEGKKGIESIFYYIRDTIFELLALIVIGIFLYIGYKIIISRGNPEEFKKAFMMLIYAILGILFISLSWVVVMFISGLNI